VRNLVMIGDETGTMDRMLGEAADHIERISKMTADTRQALIYPAFVFSAIFAAGGFWIYYVIPNLADLFKQMNAKLPPLTIAVMAGSEWLIAHIAWILAGLVAAAFVFWVTWRYSRGFRRAIHYTLHKLPIARTIMFSSGLAFFTEYMSLLIKAGVDMVSSLQVMERAMRDEYYRDRIIAIRQVLERGDRVSSAMRQVGGFPSMMVRMIGVGEETGTLDSQFARLSAEYSLRLQRLITNLSEIIKPVVVLLAGGMFVFLIVALLLPVYDLVQQAITGPKL
jgi:general secretion pathway protein F/type IV pilus assembly protein PilC